jgi:DNA-binding transcriptional MerR regulator
MHAYGVNDVERLLHLSKSTLRALVNAGFVSPARGARNTWRFSFQDLIVLRTAQALVEANVPQRRITQSLKRLAPPPSRVDAACPGFPSARSVSASS